MKRLERIQEALQQLNPGGAESVPYHYHISRTLLMELADCLYYVCFPECSNPPTRVVPSHVGEAAVMEWVLGHAADIMISQMYSAFILHGDPQAVEASTLFEPLLTVQRTPLDWNGSNGAARTFSKFMGNSQAQTACVNTETGHCEEVVTVLRDTSEDNDFRTRCRARAEVITSQFFVKRLPHVRWLLHTDVEAILKNDVAATSPSEVVLCYPAVRCMLHQRVAHHLYLLGVPMNFTRMLTEIAHSLTGIDIHPTTSIGHHFFIDHGTGIVVGATAIIGNNVSLYQGVTLGAKSFPVDKKTGERILNLPRHPILEDGVTIYANAVVLGRVTIGEGSTIGGNCWVVRSIPRLSSIVQKSHHMLKPHERMFLQRDGSGI